VCRPCGTLRASFRETRAVCSKEMILSGPEGLEGQKNREAQHEFSTLADAMLRERYVYFIAGVNAAGPRLAPRS
jgi:hypothetical protein